MNHAMSAILALYFLFGADARCGEASAAYSRSTSVPDKLMTKGGSSPFFISLASLETTPGLVDWDSLPETTRTLLQSRIADKRRHRVRPDGSVAPATNSGPCEIRTITPHDQTDSRSWTELTASAPAAYRGTIVGTSTGLLADQGRPVTILAVEIAKVIRTAPGYPVSGIIYVQTSAIDVVFGGERFCDGGQHGDFLPKAGDAVLIFPARGPVDEMGVVLPVADGRIIFSRQGETRLPSSLADDATLPETTSLDALTRDALRVAGRDR